MNAYDNQNTLCSICESNGYIRYNCTNAMIVRDLQELVENTNNLYTRSNDIEQLLNNIRDHNPNMEGFELLSLLAYMVTSKNCNDEQVNLNCHIKMEIKKTSDVGTFDCAVCMENIPLFDSLTFDCKHTFCGECVVKNIKNDKYTKSLQCYLCRSNVKIINMYDDKVIYDKLKEQLDK